MLPPRPTTHVVTVVIREAGRVLMVHEQGPDGAASHWALPGGVVEAGELLTEALVREAREETGLEVLDPGRLLYVVHTDDILGGHCIVVFAFEVAAWRGELKSADADGLVLGAHFRPISGMAEEFTHLGPVRSRPLLSYLRGETPPGALWIYRRDARGDEQMTVYPPPPDHNQVSGLPPPKRT